MNFKFSNIKIITVNRTTYPILLADVKSYSQFFRLNPSDTSYDSYIENTLIPTVVRDWELTTKYNLLDKTIKAYVPNLVAISNNNLEIPLCEINVREIQSLKYYPSTWNESDARESLTNFISSEEILNFPRVIRITKDQGSLEMYNISNNLEVTYLAGFASNNFSTLDPNIKRALATQAAMAVDSLNGFCEDFYSQPISSIYSSFKIKKDYVKVV